MNPNQKTNKKKPKHPPNRPTIGVLIDYARPLTAGGYQSILWNGISDYIKEKDANLICFAGRALQEPYEFETQRNVVYNLADPKNVDALILCGGLGNFVTQETYQQFCDRYKPLPIVSIAFPVKGYPTVKVNNEKGIKNAIHHLVEHHGYKRFAFIRGLIDNKEAEIRYRIFTQILHAYGIPLIPDLIAPGDFLPPTGSEAIHLFFDQRKLHPGKDIEVIFAANDGMALGALEALHQHHIEVPDEVALIGFDDIPEANLVTPPLTTVRQPLYEQGRHAADIAFKSITSNKTPKSITLSSELVIRQSCGCLPQAIQNLKISWNKYQPSKQTVTLSDKKIQKEMILKITESLKMVSAEKASNRAVKLVNSFISDVTDQSSNRFLSCLGTFLRQSDWRKETVYLWQKVISILHQQTLSLLIRDNQALSRADLLWQQARIYVSEINCNVLYFHHLQSEKRSVRLSQINEVLSTTFNISELMNVLTKELPRMNIASCYVSLYEQDGIIPSQWSRLILAYHQDKPVPPLFEGKRFLSHELVPLDLFPLDRPYSMLVQPLFFRESHLGFILFEMDHSQQDVYETLRRQISTALKGALLFEERERARRELAQSNEDLEQFAYVASHDLKEPLRTVSNYLQLIQQDYKKILDKKATKYFNIAINGAIRMNTLINDLLTYSRVSTYTRSFKPVDCSALLKSVLTDLSLMIKESKSCITHDKLPRVIADNTQLRRVFQNLIDNAIKFHGEQPPQIHIGAEYNVNTEEGCPAHWVFYIRDNGIGINEDYFERIFKIFQRLHSQDMYKGTGIGLAICKKIIERHNGRIWLDSKLGKGTTFYFTIPDKMKYDLKKTGS